MKPCSLDLVSGSRSRVPIWYRSQVDFVLSQHEEFESYEDEALKDSFMAFVEELKSSETYDDRRITLLCCLSILVEAGYRTINMLPHGAQIMAALYLFDGDITEVSTGEGKTFICSLVAILKSLDNNDGTVILTSNISLAREAVEKLTPLYLWVGISVSWSQDSETLTFNEEADELKRVYRADVVYSNAEDHVFVWLNDKHDAVSI